MMRSPTEIKEISPQLKRAFTFIMPVGFNHPKTRTHVRLLGPCFKTGRSEPFCQHRRRAENFNQSEHTQPALLVVPEMQRTESQSIA